MSSPGMGLQHLAIRTMMSLMPSTAIPKSPERACGSSTPCAGRVGSISGGGVASFIVPEAGIALLATVLTGTRPEPMATKRSSALAKPISLQICPNTLEAVSYTHLRAHETRHDLVCRLLLEKKKTK